MLRHGPACRSEQEQMLGSSGQRPQMVHHVMQQAQFPQFLHALLQFVFGQPAAHVQELPQFLLQCCICPMHKARMLPRALGSCHGGFLRQACLMLPHLLHQGCGLLPHVPQLLGMLSLVGHQCPMQCAKAGSLLLPQHQHPHSLYAAMVELVLPV